VIYLRMLGGSAEDRLDEQKNSGVFDENPFRHQTRQIAHESSLCQQASDRTFIKVAIMIAIMIVSARSAVFSWLSAL
jgi:hypothetical protein